MPLSCELCLLEFCDVRQSGSSSSLVKTELFDDAVQLRSHLVESHAKYVSEALLAPNIQNKVHVWLMANIDYSANVEQQQAVTEEPPFELANQNGNNVENEVEEDANEDPIKMLLNGLLGNPAMAEMEQQSTSSMAQLQLSLEETTNDVGEENANSKLDIFGTALKSLLFPSTSASSPHSDDSSAPSCRASMVDSKAVRKAHCQVCNLDICSTARQRHVYMVHLKKKDLFKCPHCEYTNSNSVWEVQKHSRVQHGKDAKPISQEEKNKLEIQMWSQLCFPEWKQKRKMDWESGEEVKRRKEDNIDFKTDAALDVNELLEGFGEVFGGLFGVQVQNNECHEGMENGRDDHDHDGEHEEFEEEGKSSELNTVHHQVTEESSGRNDRLCHLCMEESKYPGRHIAQRHLKMPLYECPICRKFGSYESCTVNKHIHKVHPKEAKNATPISNLEKYADEIRGLQARCFPNRQMKLVRPVNNSGKVRPRERHHCGICNADVAQSDRQRHVFHKHLRKGKIFECPLCDFSSNYDIHRVKWHIKWDHKDYDANVLLEPISHEAMYRDEIDALNEKCFPGWQRKRQLSNMEDVGRLPDETPTLKSEVDDEQDLDYSSPKSQELDEQECLNEEYDYDEDEEPKSKSKLDGLVEKAMKTVAMVIKHQNQQRNTPEKIRPLSELDGTANALEWNCQLCESALKPGTNLLRHVAKDHLNLPLYQCPICENHGAHSAYEVRSHMLRSHADTTQEPLSNLEEHLDEIEHIYRRCFPYKEFKVGGERDDAGPSRLMDEARVRCKECGQEMKTEDRQIHVYRHHLREPRLYECPACDFSHYACSSDVRNHIIRAHKSQPMMMPRANLLRYSKEIAVWNERCFPGWINRRLPASVVEDFNSCRLCGMEVRQTSRHIAEHHLHMPLHQCPLCEYGAAEARLVQRHMRNNHTLKECESLQPIANVEKHRYEFSELHNSCFPGRPKRLSNITIADESRRAKCRGCGQTISKKRRLVHLLEKHLHKSIYKCKYCLFTSTHERAAVEAHQQEKHSGKTKNVISTLNRHKAELKRLATECFNEPGLKLEE